MVLVGNISREVMRMLVMLLDFVCPCVFARGNESPEVGQIGSESIHPALLLPPCFTTTRECA